MPKDHIGVEDDHHMELVNGGGISYWLPVSDREGTNISNYSKWEQAFRVFANIYNDFFPNKLGELIQYNHIIQTALQSFTSDNMYRYDREFRLDISKHHPFRSWGVILQQAWTMFMKDRVTTPMHFSHGGRNNGGSQAHRWICFDFNSGNCTYGHRCRFDHRCSFCNKFGHGAFNCRRVAAKGNKNKNHSAGGSGK